jgi:pantothenate kinase-related protein Tda10
MMSATTWKMTRMMRSKLKQLYDEYNKLEADLQTANVAKSTRWRVQRQHELREKLAKLGTRILLYEKQLQRKQK